MEITSKEFEFINKHEGLKLTLAEKISPIMQELEMLFLENSGIKQNYDLATFRAGIYIFQTVMMDKMFERQLRDDLDIHDSSDEAVNLGREIKNLVAKYTGIDTFDLFKM